MSATPIAELRNGIASALHRVNANQLPAVCERFGLASGTREEAFASKQAYVAARTAKLNRVQVISLARSVLEEYRDHELEEELAKIDEASSKLVSEVTRRSIGRALNDFDLAGRLSLLVLLRDVWPIETTRSPLNDGRTLAEYILDSYNGNFQWRSDNALELAGAYTCSQ